MEIQHSIANEDLLPNRILFRSVQQMGFAGIDAKKWGGKLGKFSKGAFSPFLFPSPFQSENFFKTT